MEAINNNIEYQNLSIIEEKLQTFLEENIRFTLDDEKFCEVLENKINEIHQARLIYDKERLKEHIH